MLRDNPPGGVARPPWPADRAASADGGAETSGASSGCCAGCDGSRMRIRARPCWGSCTAPRTGWHAAFGGRRRDGVHMALDHQIAKSPWSAAAFRRAIVAAERHLPPPLAADLGVLEPRSVAPHDPVGALNEPGWPRCSSSTLRGTICVYQGEEIGMVDVPPGAHSPWVARTTGPDATRRAPRSTVDEVDPAAARSRTRYWRSIGPSSTFGARHRRSDAERSPSARTCRRDALGYERTAGRERSARPGNMGAARTRIRLLGNVGATVVAATAIVSVPRIEDGRLTLEPCEGVLLRLS